MPTPVMISRSSKLIGSGCRRRSQLDCPNSGPNRETWSGDRALERNRMDRFDLGSHSRTISTASGDAQRWFDAGLNWCFAFNKAEGVKCFRKALAFDPECVMAHWGIAY